MARKQKQDTLFPAFPVLPPHIPAGTRRQEFRYSRSIASCSKIWLPIHPLCLFVHSGAEVTGLTQCSLCIRWSHVVFVDGSNGADCFITVPLARMDSLISICISELIVTESIWFSNLIHPKASKQASRFRRTHINARTQRWYLSNPGFSAASVFICHLSLLF